MTREEYLDFRKHLLFNLCRWCAHDEACAEIGGHQEARGFGTACDRPDSDPHFRRKRGLQRAPGNPDDCPMTARTCAQCEHIEACMADLEADFQAIAAR